MTYQNQTTMQQRVQLTIMSHLSDIQHHPENMNHLLNFVKFLLSWYPNTTEQHDPERDYQHFKDKHPNL